MRFTYVFSSDLDRASDTANGICDQQLGAPLLAPIQTPLLKEQDFGSLEGTRWQSAAPASSTGSSDALRGGEPSYTEEESMASMRSRANSFLNDYIIPLIKSPSGNEQVVAVVAHGVILQVLWVCLTELFDPRDIHIGPGMDQGDITDYVRPTWSNVGYMELDLRPLPRAPPLMRNPVPFTGAVQSSVQLADSSVQRAGWGMTVMSVDNTLHLYGVPQINRTGGTVRNPAHGSRQQPMDNFYRLTGSV